LEDSRKENSMTRYSIAKLYADCNGALPGLDSRGDNIFYQNRQGDRLCASCATGIWRAWLDQREVCASDMGYDEIEERGYVVYQPQVPTTYQVIYDGPVT